MSDPLAVARRIDIPAAGRYRLDPFRSSVIVRTRLFGLEPLTCRMLVAGGELDVDPALPRATVTAAINAASFSTGNGRRDNDVRSARFLNADEYPELIFRAGGLARDAGRWTLAGELTVRDVTRPVTLEIDSVEAAGPGFRARATARVDRYAYGLTLMKGMGGRFFHVEVTAAADPR